MAEEAFNSILGILVLYDKNGNELAWIPSTLSIPFLGFHPVVAAHGCADVEHLR